MTRLRPMLIVAALSTAAAYITSAQSPPSEVPTGLKMTAQKYGFSPNTIKVKRGDRVRLAISATDREHGFKLEAFHIEQKLPKSETVTVEFTADHVGTFPFQCSRFCGIGHSKMKGQLVVE